MTAQTAVETSIELTNAAMQTSGGGGLSWQMILLVVVGAIAFLALAWILWGGTGSSD